MAETERCARCGKPLLPDQIVWLELDTRDNRWMEPGTVPAEHSQGCFPFGRECAKQARGAGGKSVEMNRRTSIRVGQRLIRWDAAKGYVDTNSRGKQVYDLGESFQVVWLDHDGTIEDAQTCRLDDCAGEGIRWGRGLMPWAR